MKRTLVASGAEERAHDGQPGGLHAMRRREARCEISERVTLRAKGGDALVGWAINASRTGLRAILEDASSGEDVPAGGHLRARIPKRGRHAARKDGAAHVLHDGHHGEPIALGDEYELTFDGAAHGEPSLRARVVWVQEEPDGVIVGFELLRSFASEGRIRVRTAHPSAPRIRVRSSDE